MARQLIESLSDEFDPTKFEDTYRNQVMELIERKASGKAEVVAPPVAMAEDKVVDLMAALEASVKEAKAARTRHPTAAAEAATEAGAEKPAAPAKKRARKSA
jgi:DNA end-binding protein Ku